MKENYIGIAKDLNGRWQEITLVLYDKMLTIKLYTAKHWHPRFYFYTENQFTYGIASKNIQWRWFLGLKITRIK